MDCFVLFSFQNVPFRAKTLVVNQKRELADENIYQIVDIVFTTHDMPFVSDGTRIGHKNTFRSLVCDSNVRSKTLPAEADNDIIFRKVIGHLVFLK